MFYGIYNNLNRVINPIIDNKRSFFRAFLAVSDSASNPPMGIFTGPSLVYIITRSISQGRVAGIVLTLGIEVGTLFYVIVTGFGVSELLASSALAFSAVKYLGAAYLVYLGICQILVHERLQLAEVAGPSSLKHIFFQAVLVDVFNPKTALFFFAFLPQFVNSSQGSLAKQVLFLGCIFVVMATLIDGIYALLAGSIGSYLRGNLRFLRAQHFFAGSVYISLGVTTALYNPK